MDLSDFHIRRMSIHDFDMKMIMNRNDILFVQNKKENHSNLHAKYHKHIFQVTTIMTIYDR